MAKRPCKVRTKAPPPRGAFEPGGAHLWKERRELVSDHGLYLAFPLSELQDYEDSANIVLGLTVDEIATELEKLHPCKISNGSFVLPTTHTERTELPEDQREYLYTKEYKNIDYPAWRILRRPLLTTDSPEEVRAATAIVGPVFVLPQQFVQVDLDAEGFTCRETAGGEFLQVNHNPKAIALRPWREAMKEYESRTTSGMPEEILHALYLNLHPKAWPRDHKFSNVIKGREMFKRSGWNHESLVRVDLYDFMDLLDLTCKLNPDERGWWREHNSRGSYHMQKFTSNLVEALNHLHTIEAKVNKARQVAREEGKLRYKRHVAPALKRWKKHVPTFDQWWHSDGRALFTREDKRMIEEARFCRWLRTEARACEITIPASPVEPVKPGAKLKKKRKSA